MSEARDRLSLVAHAAMPLCNPMTLEELDVLLDHAPVGAGDHVVDVGAGRGDAALQVRGARLTLVDRSPVYLDEARIRAAGRADVELVIADAATYLERAPGDVTLAICLGASHALSGLEAAARALAEHARCVVIGDLVSLGPRGEETFGAPRLDSLALPDVRARIVLGPERVAAYEDAWSRSVTSHLDVHPDDPAAEWARARIAWMHDHADALAEVALVAWTLGGS